MPSDEHTGDTCRICDRETATVDGVCVVCHNYRVEYGRWPDDSTDGS